jgi:hypothetical protein
MKSEIIITISHLNPKNHETEHSGLSWYEYRFWSEPMTWLGSLLHHHIADSLLDHSVIMSQICKIIFLLEPLHGVHTQVLLKKQMIGMADITLFVTTLQL